MSRGAAAVDSSGDPVVRNKHGVFAEGVERTCGDWGLASLGQPWTLCNSPRIAGDAASGSLQIYKHIRQSVFSVVRLLIEARFSSGSNKLSVFHDRFKY